MADRCLDSCLYILRYTRRADLDLADGMFASHLQSFRRGRRERRRFRPGKKKHLGGMICRDFEVHVFFGCVACMEGTRRHKGVFGP